jgi:hypothetical protein
MAAGCRLSDSQAREALPLTDAKLLVLVLWGSERPCRFARRPGVRIARIGEVDAGGGRVIERDLRKADEEKPTYALG